MGQVAPDSDNLVLDHLDATFWAEEIEEGDPNALKICQATYDNRYRQR